MISTRKIKVRCDDSTFYTFFRQEQREQNKALNIGIGIIHANAVLHNVDSGAEKKLKKSIEGLQGKIDKLNKDLEKEKITDKKKEEVLKAIETNKKILDGEKKAFKESEEYRKGIDELFKNTYLKSNTLDHVLDSMVNIQYKRTLSLVTQRIKKDYSNDFVGIITGQQSLRNYRNDNPLMISNQQLNFKYIDDTFYLDIMCGYRLEVVLGKRDNENVNELKSTLEKVISKEYKVCDSSMQFAKNNKDIILNLVIDIPQNSNVYKPVEGRTLGVDLGIAVPIYMCLNDDTYKRKGLGDINNFLRVRQQMQTRRRKLQKDLTLTNGGKGRKKKTQLLDKLQENERNFVKTYSHALSKRVVEFAKSNKCEYINIEKLTKDGFDNIILRNWSYFELQKMIEYKAEREGIAVRYVNPAYTSQKCSRCGEIDKENRQTQANFKCTKCGFELNADHNAAINIARSIEFV
ncbi:TPA: transposase [Clostridioides difficile]|uniref:RNA-guided endonuclease InsQ/TnpB family protein n=1 Tax=Clostridioides difficile TaxID=1496 RepID=UPI0007BAF909|nr:RNA-guided endonuclease TnpB family protein [Clostridioides difficile]MDV9593489.1 transposase [Clostridioides difficile]CZR92015.1 Putative transposase DNA-binding domain protein [Clostridioides difficile]CZR94020.1 Putative transposase DNA-binding domain protein [Clostridioides difficile]SJW04122.1 transposase, IS605 OrfB family, central region [Clostridioides difficile]HBG3235919.1 transposase [Clostridioides difficile]